MDIAKSDLEKAKLALSRFDIGNDDPDIWYELRLLEKYGVDWSYQADVIHSLLTDFEAPWEGNPDFTPEFERCLLLRLRDEHRSDLGLPLLSDEEKRSWVFRQVPTERFVFEPPETNRQLSMADAPQLTKEQLDTVVRCFQERYSDVANMLLQINDFQASDKESGWLDNYPYKDPFHISRQHLAPVTWIYVLIEDCICKRICRHGFLDISNESYVYRKLRGWTTKQSE